MSEENEGLDKNRAANLRRRFNRFIEDWESPDMSVYDDYDSARAKVRQVLRAVKKAGLDPLPHDRLDDDQDL